MLAFGWTMLGCHFFSLLLVAKRQTLAVSKNLYKMKWIQMCLSSLNFPGWFPMWTERHDWMIGLRHTYVLGPAFRLECVRGNCEWKNTCLVWRSGCLQPWWLSIFATLELLAMKKLSQTKICSDRIQSTKQRREQSWRNTCSLSSKMSTRCWAVFVHCRRNLVQWWLSIFATLELLAMKKLFTNQDLFWEPLASNYPVPKL